MSILRQLEERWRVVDRATYQPRPGLPNVGGLFASPVLLDGRLLVLNSLGLLTAYDDDGSKPGVAWTRELGPIEGDRLSWRRCSDLADDGQMAFIPGSEDRVPLIYAADRQGQVRWQAAVPAGVKRMAVGRDVLHVAVADQLLALSIADGSVLRHTSLPFHALSLACPAGATLYLGGRDHHLHAADAATGQIRWSFRTGRQVAGLPTAANGRVWFGSNDGAVYCVEDRNDRAELVWRYETGSYVRDAAVLSDGTIYVGSWDRHAYALDAETGSMRWKFRVNNYVDADPVVDETNRCVYILSARRLFAIDTDSGDLVCEKALTRGIYFNNHPALDARRGMLYLAGGEKRDLQVLSAFRLEPCEISVVPEIRMIPRPDVPRGFSFPVMASFSHDAGVRRADLHYRSDGERQFESTEFVRGGWGSLWVAYVPADAVRGAFVEYYAEATAVGPDSPTACGGVRQAATFSEEPLTPGWYPGDPHCHDEFDNVISLVQAARENGCFWTAASNHLSIHSTKALKHSSSARFVGVDGDEIGLVDAGPHVLNIGGAHGLNVDGTPQEAVDQINEEGGVVYFAHGNWNVELTGWKGTANWLADVEGHDEYDEIWNRHLNDGHRILIIEGSDERARPQPGTYVYVESLTRDNIIEALRRGHSFVAYPGLTVDRENVWRGCERRPFYEMDFRLDETPMGGTLCCRVGQKIRCRVFAAGDVHRMSLIRGDYTAADAIETFTATGGRIEADLGLVAERSAWYRLQVVNARGGLALRSNPIWVDCSQ